MKTAKKSYTNAQLELLYGQIEGSDYSSEVCAVLTQWAKEGKIHKRFKQTKPSTVRSTVHFTMKEIEAEKSDPNKVVKKHYLEEVWDAILEVLDRRKVKAEQRTARLEEVLS